MVLANIGFVLLAVNAVLAARREPWRSLSLAAAGLFAVCVYLVWSVRFDWAFDLAVRLEFAGFMLFHSALIAIVFAAVSPGRFERGMVLVAFFITSVGANLAAWPYDAPLVYLLPIVATTLLGTGFVAYNLVATLRTTDDNSRP